ncbi:unnamed protein product [Onchocerca flexuosa]|uniref:GLOBIN domain-containing protein n=1 Tax=Onchocerca flexuosa TaxID=387005 RepID=A0A183HYI9_9BILA|nr:unnamed protein product [Onchocerca flexuosa]
MDCRFFHAEGKGERRKDIRGTDRTHFSRSAAHHSMSISVGDDSSNRSLIANRHSQWKNQKVFIDRIYQMTSATRLFSKELGLWKLLLHPNGIEELISNNCHPGIGLDQAAAEHIQEILICLFFELLECHPQTVEDMERSMRTTLPASMFHWVIQVIPFSKIFIFSYYHYISFLYEAFGCSFKILPKHYTESHEKNFMINGMQTRKA